MKSILVYILLGLWMSSLFAINWEWISSGGASSLDRVWDIALDSQGNTYLTGEFSDTLRIGNFQVPGWGLNDIFVAKYDPNGNPLWAKAFGGASGDVGLGIDVDGSGNSYITGYIGADAVFGNVTLISHGSWDVYVAKLDPNGEVLWAFNEGGTSNDIGYGITTSLNGMSIVTGWFGDTSIFHDNSTLASFGGSDILTAAFDTSGNILWKRQAGSAGVEYGYKVDMDYYGNSYVTGSAGQNASFDGQYPDGNGMFIASYDINGVIRWVKSGSGAGVNGIAVDKHLSDIEQFGCVTGRITGTAQFGNYNVSSYLGSDDGYNAKFELLTGDWQSVAITIGPGSDKGRACAYNIHPYYTGSFENTCSIFGYDTSSFGGSDVYVFSDEITLADWALSAGGINNDVSTDIVADMSGNVYICGWFSGIARFGNHLINSGSDSNIDFFIGKINPTTAIVDNTLPILGSKLNCYPNPFRSSINFEMEQKGNTGFGNFSLFNVKGERVRYFKLPAVGNNKISIVWNGKDDTGRDCPTGVYFAKLNNGTASVTTRIFRIR